MQHSVYLAGPISGLSYSESVDWRKSVAADLEAVGIRAFSPMRHKDYLAGEKCLAAVIPDTMKRVMSTHRGIISRDRFDATRCDVLFVNLLGAKTVSIGTMMELAWADLSRTPIVFAMEAAGNVHEHGMVMEAINFRVPTLEEAVHVVKCILL